MQHIASFKLFIPLHIVLLGRSAPVGLKKIRNREESCSLHCYSVEHVPIGDTQTLSELAQALVDGVDETLRAYAATIPVNQR